MVFLFLLWRFCGAYWEQPLGACVNYTFIQSDLGKLSTNEGILHYSNNVNCTWEIITTIPTIYVMISGSGLNQDYLMINGNQIQTAQDEFHWYSSPMIVVFTSGNNGSDIGFTVYWQILMDTPDRIQLLDFYISTNAMYWLSPWNFNFHHCVFFGVKCVGNFSVESLILPQNNMNGFLPKGFNLPFLNSLDLSYNKLHGTIPASIMKQPPHNCNLEGNFFCGSEFPPSCFEMGYDLCYVKEKIETKIINESGYKIPVSPNSSPYPKVLSSRTDAHLVLKATYSKVIISGVIADIKLVQVYYNSGNVSIDVDYYFPASPTAIVYGMQFVNNGQLVVAQLRDNAQAEILFKHAKDSGNTSALLRKDSESILKLRITNIQSQTILRVEIFYTEQIIPDEGTYQFYYPSIIPPQYLDEMEEATQDPSQFKCLLTMDITVQVPLSLTNVACLTHEINITQINNTAHARFSTIGLISDLLIEYSMSGKEIQAGMIFYESYQVSNEDAPFNIDNGYPLPMAPWNNFFMSIVESPKMDFTTDWIVPREYIFVLDTSASMVGRPIMIADMLMHSLLFMLNPQVDIFNIVSFSGECLIFQENSVAATANNLSDALSFIRKTTIGGFSNLLPALQKAMLIPKSPHYSHIITIITDGLIAVPKSVLQFIQQKRQIANFYSIAIGTVPNRYLTQGIATVGGGKEFWIQHSTQVEQIAQKFIKHVLSPVLTNLTLEFNPDFGVDLSTLSPLSDVMSDKPLVISGQYLGSIPDGKLFTINGLTANGKTWTKDVYPTFLPTHSPKSLVYLWAGSKIRELEFLSEDINQITKLSFNYNVLSKYTSFIAVGTDITMLHDNVIDAITPLSIASTRERCMRDCPTPNCSGKCFPAFDNSTDYCPLSGCSPNEYCANGVCIQGNVTDCSCENYCAPFTCNGVVCPLVCSVGICFHGTCNDSTIPEPTGSCDNKCPPHYLCAGGKCYYYKFLNYISSNTTSQEIPTNCSLHACSPKEICDKETNLCLRIVEQDTSPDCEGELVGDNTFICNNGNFIYLSSSMIAPSNLLLEGTLAVEGDLIFFQPISILMTINSLILSAHDVSIPPGSTITINFLSLSLDEIDQFLDQEDIETKSLQIIKAQNTIVNLSTLQVIVINNPHPNCYRLKNNTGLRLLISLCKEDDIILTNPQITGIVLGAIGLAIVIGVMGGYYTYQIRLQNIKQLDITLT